MMAEEKKKMGRPTEEVKSHDLRVRISERLYSKMIDYSKEHDQTTAETAREAIEKLLKE